MEQRQERRHGSELGYRYFGGGKMPAGMDEGAHKYMPLVIKAIGVALLLFARAIRGRGVLR